jgi:hypothetical protein
MCLLKLDLPKKLQEAKNADVDTNRRWDTFRQWMDTKFSFNCVKRLTPKGKQLASRDKEPTTENNHIMSPPRHISPKQGAAATETPSEDNPNTSKVINYANYTDQQIYQTIQKGLQQGQVLADAK